MSENILLSEEQYRSLTDQLVAQGLGLRHCHEASARKLVEGAEAYARQWGFSPHADYQKAKRIFGDIDVTACSRTFEYGRGGKPCYISGPNDSLAFQRKVTQKLSDKIEPGDGDYL